MVMMTKPFETLFFFFSKKMTEDLNLKGLLWLQCAKSPVAGFLYYSTPDIGTG